jgi:hypothetical protein
MIRSTVFSNKEAIENITKLYGDIELDPTFSSGKFYKGLKEPIGKSDIHPQRGDVRKCDCRRMPIVDNDIKTIMFDPPFMFGTHGQTKNNIMNKRFTMFDTFSELVEMYKSSLKEFHRILVKKGILIFKCQDYTDSRTTMTHCLVYNWAFGYGFYARDLFILINNSRIYNPNLTQRHARKTHSYFWVFQK